jgi:hypothetical protein
VTAAGGDPWRTERHRGRRGEKQRGGERERERERERDKRDRGGREGDREVRETEREGGRETAEKEGERQIEIGRETTTWGHFHPGRVCPVTRADGKQPSLLLRENGQPWRARVKRLGRRWAKSPEEDQVLGWLR